MGLFTFSATNRRYIFRLLVAHRMKMIHSQHVQAKLDALNNDMMCAVCGPTLDTIQKYKSIILFWFLWILYYSERLVSVMGVKWKVFLFSFFVKRNLNSVDSKYTTMLWNVSSEHHFEERLTVRLTTHCIICSNMRFFSIGNNVGVLLCFDRVQTVAR